MAQITLVEAINLALHHEMARDATVVTLGQDVGADGGVFRATVGLLDKFGAERALDTPLAEAMFAHIPGIRVVYPSSPLRAYGLLLAAIRDPDPVIFLEPTRLYRLFREDVADGGEALPLDVSFTLREGTDVTLVTWGAMVHETLAAADALAEEGVAAEVIDIATLKPLDMTAILESVGKTGRCVIVTEGARTASFASEIAANLAEDGLLTLLAPVIRITGWDTVVPLARLEKHYMPDTARIVAAVRKTLAYS